tara:strand:- start:29948 stop:30448 length:501 start_codon:yes stop_codon:yes gene_type:complete
MSDTDTSEAKALELSPEAALLAQLVPQLLLIGQALTRHVEVLNHATSVFALAISKRVVEVGQDAPLRVIAEDVCLMTGISVREMRGRRRFAAITEARQIAMYLSVQLTDCSTTQIGNFYNRDHSTVIHARDKFQFYQESANRRFERVAVLQTELSQKMLLLFGGQE